MTLVSSKRQLRQKILQQRQSLTQETWQEKSLQLCQVLESCSYFQAAKTILAYFPFRQEPDLNSMFKSDHRWGFSRCVDGSLIWHHWTPGNRLNEGTYGILEPHFQSPILTPSEVDLILVPAVACDKRGYRLGYGGGFYDRLLSSPQWQNIPTIGIIFDFAYLPILPVDSWDKPLEAICTESQIISIYA
ncbi:5-formyltetrahydrofolate cyclo-ligase [Aphanothece sacrum]|uniref:5-formyltetrahydrofolate cyclo-ligase n=1 Tax=Aphanothece sacrum TaxID=1122 RepID=UPI000F60C8F2|nr:5-formyltetrahydrofolate cyclo-ligase [Aphanothece sacrum]